MTTVMKMSKEEEKSEESLLEHIQKLWAAIYVISQELLRVMKKIDLPAKDFMEGVRMYG